MKAVLFLFASENKTTPKKLLSTLVTYSDRTLDINGSEVIVLSDSKIYNE